MSRSTKPARSAARSTTKIAPEEDPPSNTLDEQLDTANKKVTGSSGTTNRRKSSRVPDAVLNQPNKLNLRSRSFTRTAPDDDDDNPHDLLDDIYNDTDIDEPQIARSAPIKRRTRTPQHDDIMNMTTDSAWNGNDNLELNFTPAPQHIPDIFTVSEKSDKPYTKTPNKHNLSSSSSTSSSSSSSGCSLTQFTAFWILVVLLLNALLVIGLLLARDSNISNQQLFSSLPFISTLLPSMASSTTGGVQTTDIHDYNTAINNINTIGPILNNIHNLQTTKPLIYHNLSIDEQTTLSNITHIDTINDLEHIKMYSLDNIPLYIDPKILLSSSQFQSLLKLDTHHIAEYISDLYKTNNISQYIINYISKSLHILQNENIRLNDVVKIRDNTISKHENTIHLLENTIASQGKTLSSCSSDKETCYTDKQKLVNEMNTKDIQYKKDVLQIKNDNKIDIDNINKKYNICNDNKIIIQDKLDNEINLHQQCKDNNNKYNNTINDAEVLYNTINKQLQDKNSQYSILENQYNTLKQQHQDMIVATTVTQNQDNTTNNNNTLQLLQTCQEQYNKCTNDNNLLKDELKSEMHERKQSWTDCQDRVLKKDDEINKLYSNITLLKEQINNNNNNINNNELYIQCQADKKRLERLYQSTDNDLSTCKNDIIKTTTSHNILETKRSELLSSLSECQQERQNCETTLQLSNHDNDSEDDECNDAINNITQCYNNYNVLNILYKHLRGDMREFVRSNEKIHADECIQQCTDIYQCKHEFLHHDHDHDGDDHDHHHDIHDDDHKLISNEQSTCIKQCEQRSINTMLSFKDEFSELDSNDDIEHDITVNTTIHTTNDTYQQLTSDLQHELKICSEKLTQYKHNVDKLQQQLQSIPPSSTTTTTTTTSTSTTSAPVALDTDTLQLLAVFKNNISTFDSEMGHTFTSLQDLKEQLAALQQRGCLDQGTSHGQCRGGICHIDPIIQLIQRLTLHIDSYPIRMMIVVLVSSIIVLPQLLLFQAVLPSGQISRCIVLLFWLVLGLYLALYNMYAVSIMIIVDFMIGMGSLTCCRDKPSSSSHNSKSSSSYDNNNNNDYDDGLVRASYIPGTNVLTIG